MQAFDYRWPGLLLRMAFSSAVKPKGCTSWPMWFLKGIDWTSTRSAWGAKLLLTAVLAYSLSIYGYFNLPWVPPTPPASQPTNPIDMICDITGIEKAPSNTSGI